MSRRHRRMGGKNGGSWYDFKRRFEIHLMGRHGLSESFDTGKCRVPFVHVADFGMQAQCCQGTHTADAQQHLLSQANLGFTGV